MKFTTKIGSALALVLVVATAGCSSDKKEKSASTVAPTTTAVVASNQSVLGATVRVSTLSSPRGEHTATGTPGGVVVIGGESRGNVSGTIEMYVNGQWVGVGTLAEARKGHTATLLSNGKIMVAGGQKDASGNQILSSIEIVDPVAKTVTAGPMMGSARSSHVAVPFRIQGKEFVLLSGGAGLKGSLASAELYDVATNNIVPLGAQMTEDRVAASAVFMPSGQILIQGGLKNFTPGALQMSAAGAELFNPVSRTFSKAGSLSIDRYASALALTDAGRAIVFGGNSSARIEATSERFDATTGQWSAAPALAEAREDLTLTPIRDGRLLAIAGRSQAMSASVEAYNGQTNEVAPLGSLIEGRSAHTATLLPNGNVLVVGGYGSTGALASVEEYSATAPPGTKPTQAPINTTPIMPGNPTPPAAPVPAPRILAIYPSNGKPGDLITIAGQNFAKDKKNNQVMFQGGVFGKVLFEVKIKRLPILGPVETLIVEVPTGVQTGDLMVVSNSQASSGKTFTLNMQSGGTPSVIYTLPSRAAPGKLVTIFGRNFARPANDNIVRFNGEQAAIIGGITTQSVPFLGNLAVMLVRVPATATTGNLTVEAYTKVSGNKFFEVKGTTPATPATTPSTPSTPGTPATPATPSTPGNTVFYSEDFEGANLTVSASGGEWEASRPQAGKGPGFAASGQWAAGTAMTVGTYGANANAFLITQEIDLTNATSATLSFSQFFDTDGTDGGRIIVSPDAGTTWYLLRPNGGYLTAAVFNPGEGFAGFSGAWLRTAADLSAFAGDKITIAFEFSSDATDQRSGWFLDDIKVEGR
ncbi:MAG: IPT/TIG domain-containing protein [Planctomycetes bacterium]|nr:IPT/TIG domain-containing protein [Planctomycetota bacterium]